MKHVYPQHLTWVLICGLLFLTGQGSFAASVEDVREITVPNSTVEKQTAFLKTDQEKTEKQPVESFLDSINKKHGINENAVLLPPKGEVEETRDNHSSGATVEILPLNLEKTKNSVPENSEQSLKILDMPSLNAVATDVELLQESKFSKNLQNNTTESPDELKGTTKSSKDLIPNEYSPKGRTLSYKEYTNNSKNADVLKNTVSSESKGLKIEEDSDKDGERWVKKQRGISNPIQMSRLNKERNLSGSYLPGLAALNTVNRTTENENDKLLIKYQRRKRPWSSEMNSSDLIIPEETTVWSLASLKSTPKEKRYGDAKPVFSWSTNLNKPTTEYESGPHTSPSPSTSVSNESEDSDWVGLTKEDVSDVTSIKVYSTSTDNPVRFNEEKIANLSGSLTLINAIPDNEFSNETLKPINSEESPKVFNQSNPGTQITTTTPEFNNVINESDSTVKPVPTITTPSVSSTTESIKNVSVYPSTISNSVNELNDEEDSNNDKPSLAVDSSYNIGNNEKQKMKDDPEKEVNSTISQNNNRTKLVNPSLLDNSNVNISKMHSGKDSYASNFVFSTSINSEVNPTTDITITKSENTSMITQTYQVTTDKPTEKTHSTENTDDTAETMSYDKVAHVTSTMLPEKGKDNSDKVTPVPSEQPSSVITNAIKENEFNIGLAGMFNTSSFDITTSKKPLLGNVTTEDSSSSYSKEFNEIPLDSEKSQGTTENHLAVDSVTSESPFTSTVSVQESTPLHNISETLQNHSETKANENSNAIELHTDLIGKTTTNTSESITESELSSIKDEIKSPNLFNNTEDFVTSTPRTTVSLHTTERIKTTSTERIKTTTQDYHSVEKIEEHSISDNETIPFFPSSESEESTEFFENNSKISSPFENFNSSEDATTHNYLSTSEPSKIPSTSEATPTPEINHNEDNGQDKFPTSEEDTIYDSIDPVFTRLLIQANDKELCSRKEQLVDSIIRLFKTNGSDIHRKQVVINNLGSKDCLFRNPPSEDGLFPIQVHLTNSQGHNDMFLTDKFIDLWQREGLDFSYPVKRVDKVIGRRKWIEMDNKSDGKSSLIAAIVISSIAGVCLLFIIILLVMIRKRQKGFNYGQRCTPVSLEDYSLDNISVYNSTRRKAVRASKRSYGNPAFDDPGVISHIVNFATLANFYNNRSHIDEEFSQIPTVSVKPDELPPGVETKNRFANVIPIPETRVTLNSTRGNNPDLDSYINANYVKGAKGEEKFYIACQAPMADTVSDFWQMIWEQQSRLVIMLTDLQEGGVEKCADYLPPSEVLDCHRVFGDLQVTLKKREVREKYVISNLQLKNLDNNLWREVVHLWLTCWPPQGIPMEPTSVIAFLIEARSYIKSKENNSPIVVHCSPGTGRTGTIIAIDICIRDFEVKRTVDVPKTVSNIRKDRAGAVQTKDQYAFIYQVLHLYATKLTGGGLDSI